MIQSFIWKCFRVLTSTLDESALHGRQNMLDLDERVKC